MSSATTKTKATKKGAKAKGKAAKAKADSKPKAKAEPKDKPLSCLDAAAVVLKGNGDPMRCKDLIAVMKGKGLWTSDAPTPHATLASALLREITKKGDASRFKKVGRGEFAYNG